MIHTHLRKAVLGIAAAVSAIATFPNSTLAQCVPGTGSTPAQLSSQTWPSRTIGDVDLTSLLHSQSNLVMNSPTLLDPSQSFQPTAVVAYGDGVALLDASGRNVFGFKLDSTSQ